MKYSRRFLRVAVLLALVFGLAAARAEAQDPHHPDQGTAAAPYAATTPEQRRGMMNQNMMKMMGEMKAADAKLDALVQAMNAAKGEEKANAIAAVVAALVEERRSMHSSMAAMMNTMNMMNQMRAPAGAAPDKPKP
jgi:hypothetical protein